MILTSFVDITRALRGCFRGGSVYVSFCFVKPPTLWRCLHWYFDCKQKEVRLRVCSNTFRNFKVSLNKRRMYPAQRITIEWTASEMLRQTTNDKQISKHKLGNRTNRWSKVQAEAAQIAKSNGNPPGRRRLKNDLIFNLRIPREVEFIQLVYSVRNIPNRICKTASKFDKRNLKNWPSLSSHSLK